MVPNILHAQDNLHTTAEKSEFGEMKLAFSGWKGLSEICLRAKGWGYRLQGGLGTGGIPKVRTVTV